MPATGDEPEVAPRRLQRSRNLSGSLFNFLAVQVDGSPPWSDTAAGRGPLVHCDRLAARSSHRPWVDANGQIASEIPQSPKKLESKRKMAAEKDATLKRDAALIAAQLAELTEHVDAMAKELEAIRTRADHAQERADTQQERIDLAARELTMVSDRLQAAANALRESI
jgi:hypothetical protein